MYPCISASSIAHCSFKDRGYALLWGPWCLGGVLYYNCIRKDIKYPKSEWIPVVTVPEPGPLGS